MSFNTISVIGLGYIGLPTAALFANCKKRVVGVDISSDTVTTINRGQIHIVEPDLDKVVHNAVAEGFLRATTQPESAEAFLIAVPTPFKNGVSGSYQPDLSYIESASISIAPVLKRGDLVILESTSPVGTTEQMTQWLAEIRPDLSFPHTHGEASDIRVAHCPERVLPGHVLHELVRNDRVIGGMTAKCSEAAASLYKIFLEGECIITDARTAEMCKLTENSFRDVNIAFANELSLICDKQGIDVWELIRLANRHPRVNILQPGPGVGGHCIAVDPWFIVSAAPMEAKIIRTAREINDHKPQWVINKVNLAVAKYLQKNPKKNKEDIIIACFGLSFKPDIDDMRESPALQIAKQLGELYPGQLLVVDPYIKSIPDPLINSLKLVDSKEAEIKAQVAVFLVKHKAFSDYSMEARSRQIVVDVCGNFI